MIKYLILLALLSCGQKIPLGCEESVETKKVNAECNPEKEFCTMLETTIENCKELDLNIMGY